MSYALNAVNKLDQTTSPLVKKTYCDFRFSTFPVYKKNVHVEGASEVVVLSDVGKGAIIARCFHLQCQTGTGCIEHLLIGEQAHVKHWKRRSLERTVRGNRFMRR